MRLRIGLTGGAATGKSAVATAFADTGVTVLSADAIAHELTSPGMPALGIIRDAFGDKVFHADGSLDRRALAQRVFADQHQRALLEGILHPPIRAALAQRAAATPGPYTVLEIPLLRADDVGQLVDRVLVVDAPREIQLARLVTRDGMDAALANAILDAQPARQSRLAVANDVLVNDGEPSSIGAAVAELDHFYRDIAMVGDTDRPGLTLHLRAS